MTEPQPYQLLGLTMDWSLPQVTHSEATDIRGMPFRVGQLIGYAGRGSTKAYIRQGVIRAVLEDGRLVVDRRADFSGVSAGKATIRPSNTATVVIDHYWEAK